MLDEAIEGIPFGSACRQSIIEHHFVADLLPIEGNKPSAAWIAKKLREAVWQADSKELKRRWNRI